MIGSEKATPAPKQAAKPTLADKVMLNPSFTSKQFRISVPIPELERVEKKQKVVQDRSHAIVATIVRLMKTNKKMAMTILVQEVMASLQMFKPQPAFIKERIEKLIDDEFLARDEEDKTMLIYLPCSWLHTLSEARLSMS